MTEDNNIVFEVMTGFGHNTQQPYVQIVIQAADWMTQMSPADAREIGMNLLAAAENAEGDGFLVNFLRETVGMDDMRAVATLLMEFRQYREAQQRRYHEGKKT